MVPMHDHIHRSRLLHVTIQLSDRTIHKEKSHNGRTWMGLNVTADEEQQWKGYCWGWCIYFHGTVFTSSSKENVRRPMKGAQWHGGGCVVMADVIGHSTGAGWCWGKCRKEFSLRASKSSKRAGNGGDATLRGKYLRAWSNMAAPVAVGDNGWPAGCGKFRRSWWGSWRW